MNAMSGIWRDQFYIRKQQNECLYGCISTWREERKEGEQQLTSTGKKERASPRTTIKRKCFITKAVTNQ